MAATESHRRPNSHLTIVDKIGVSADLFGKYVWPKIADKFGSGELVAAEGEARDRLAEVIDRNGIDYLFHTDDGELFGIAQRTQVDGCAWDTFTFRPTEYQRLREAHERPIGRLLPAIVVQSYLKALTGGLYALLSVGIVRTTELMQYAEVNPPQERSGPGGKFLYWSFSELAAGGVAVDRFPSPAFRSPFGASWSA